MSNQQAQQAELETSHHLQCASKIMWERHFSKMDGDIRAEYAETLLHFTVGKRKAAGMPLAFGEGDVK